MTEAQTPGNKLRAAVAANNPLQVVGAVNAYNAIMAQKSGHQALYLSGGGVAACSLGIPDLGISTLADVLEDARRITDASHLPLLVDIDVGWGGAFNIARCIREMIRADVAGVHIEDQIMQKRCGHRPNKAIVPSAEMVDRVKAAVDARSDEDFVIMARTDALAELDQYRQFVEAVRVPVLANITEFGATPLFTTEQLAAVGVKLALYPLSAFRAASLAALNVYRHILDDGTQQNVVDSMQTRMELYDFLDYHDYEQTLDKLFNEETS